MEFITHYDYAAIGIIAFTLFFLVTRKSLKKKENKILVGLMIMNLLSLAGDIVAVYVQADMPRYGRGWGYFWNYLYLFTHTQMSFVFLLYLVYLLGIQDKMKGIYKVVLIVPSVVSFLILLLNPVFDWYFYYNEQDVYSYGPMVPVLFAMPVIHIIFSLYLVIHYRDRMEKKMLYATGLFLMMTIGGVLVQFIIRYILIELFVQSLAILGILIAIENKDEIDALIESNEALQAERERADSANRSKSEFLANMSHEIRTPINAVLGMNEMILRDTAQNRYDSIDTYAKNIRNAGNNLLSIINDILDFSKIESGKMEIIENDYRLSTLLGDVCNITEGRALDKGLRFLVDVEPSIPNLLYGDEVRIRQIIINLLTNAIKYTKEGGVTMQVRRQEDGNGRITLIVRVIDTGIGIRPADINLLFQKFRRVDTDKNKTIEGTGLGLAITQNLIDMMEGKISVDAKYGQGSTVSVMIPQRVVDSAPIGSFRTFGGADPQEKEVYQELFHAPDAHLLVVDDTAMNLIVIKGLLKQTEVQVDTATSGADALELTAKNTYDLILMDQRMPQMDGTQAMLAIRDQEGGASKDTPVICLTADAVQGARERYLEEGFRDYLSKPVDGKHLEETLKKYLPPDKVKISVAPVKSEGGTQAVAENASTASKAADAVPAVDTVNAEAVLPETATQEEVAAEIRERTVRLLEDYRAMEAMIASVLGIDPAAAAEAEADLEEMDIEELQEIYEAIAEYSQMFDIDSIDRLLKQTEGYAIPPAEKERFAQVKKAVRDSDWDALTKVLG